MKDNKIVTGTPGGITHPLVQRLHLHSGNLHCVVVVCGGGSCMWRYTVVQYILQLVQEEK